jgi:putative transcriptional regulator
VVTLAEADAEIAAFDWSTFDALTDEDIAKAIAKDPDTFDTSKVPPGEMQPFYLIDVAALRERLGLSQTEFALRYRLSAASLRNWEQGRRRPPGGISVYLALIAAYPREIAHLLDGLDRRGRRRANAAAAE